MPLLYYPTQLLLAQGADVLWVQYGHTRTPDVVGFGPVEGRLARRATAGFLALLFGANWLNLALMMGAARLARRQRVALASP